MSEQSLTNTWIFPTGQSAFVSLGHLKDTLALWLGAILNSKITNQKHTKKRGTK